jgi:hypothetical protein
MNVLLLDTNVDAAYEVSGFHDRARVDAAQQPGVAQFLVF